MLHSPPHHHGAPHHEATQHHSPHHDHGHGGAHHADGHHHDAHHGAPQTHHPTTLQHPYGVPRKSSGGGCAIFVGLIVVILGAVGIFVVTKTYGTPAVPSAPLVPVVEEEVAPPPAKKEESSEAEEVPEVYVPKTPRVVVQPAAITPAPEPTTAIPAPDAASDSASSSEASTTAAPASTPKEDVPPPLVGLTREQAKSTPNGTYLHVFDGDYSDKGINKGGQYKKVGRTEWNGWVKFLVHGKKVSVDPDDVCYIKGQKMTRAMVIACKKGTILEVTRGYPNIKIGEKHAKIGFTRWNGYAKFLIKGKKIEVAPKHLVIAHGPPKKEEQGQQGGESSDQSGSSSRRRRRLMDRLVRAERMFN